MFFLPRMAANNAQERKFGSLEGSIFMDCLFCIFRTGRIKNTARFHYGGDVFLIYIN